MGKEMGKKSKILSAVLFFVVFGIVIGVGLYYAGYAAAPSCAIEGHKDVSVALRNEISAKQIGDYLKNLSSVPHLAGTAQDFEQAEWMRQKFLDFGLDDAYVVPYDVLLSYPNWTVPNKIYVLDESGGVRYNTSGRQPPLNSTEESSPLAAPNFNAYSGTGTAKGGLVYVNYGLQEDFDYLERVGINVTNQIALVRYGTSFRGNAVALAERKGAVGVIFFSDPQEVAQKGRNETYPNSFWMPDMGVQYGTVMLSNGDPLTHYYPAIDSAYRKPESEANLPRIPVQPIGYKEAEELFKLLNEDKEAPTKWQGGLQVKYYLGPNLKQANWTVKMEVHTKNQMAKTYSTFGVIKGKEEPDRYVLVGNHRDAWILGAVDPSSGTSSMIEMARAFGKIKKDRDWRPRRSIIFCSWGAEEYGWVASTEWVEEHAKVLATRAVAYLNTDIAVRGTYSFKVNGAPLLRQVMLESAKKVQNPNQSEIAVGRRTVYDTWQHRFPDTDLPDEPYVGTLGSGSDHTAFMHIAGIPSMDITYIHDSSYGSFPLYHTLYETYHLVSEFMDKDFHYHRAVTQMWAEMTLTLAESVILPMDIKGYAVYLKRAFNDIKGRYGKQLSDNNATLNYFERAVNQFSDAMGNFSEVILKEFDSNNAFTARRINDKLIQLERQFIQPHGLPKTIPTQQEYNHIVFAPSSSNGYASKSFSALVDLLEFVGNQTEAQNPVEWARIKEHLSVIAFMIQAAAKSLSDDLY